MDSDTYILKDMTNAMRKYRNKFDIMLTGDVEYLGGIYHYVKMNIHIFLPSRHFHRITIISHIKSY